MPSGVRGFISFHIATEEQYFTMCVSTLFHIERQRDISLSDLLHGIGLVERYFRAVFREFFSPKTALFSFFLKKTLLNFCV